MHDEYILLAWGTPGQDVYEYDDAPHPVAQSITQFIHVTCEYNTSGYKSETWKFNVMCDRRKQQNLDHKRIDTSFHNSARSFNR